jgi:hypothetical protein
MQPTEENELELTEGEIIEQIDPIADEWWSGVTSSGKTGLFPSNYVEVVPSVEPSSGGQDHGGQEEAAAAPPPPPPPPPPVSSFCVDQFAQI